MRCDHVTILRHGHHDVISTGVIYSLFFENVESDTMGSDFISCTWRYL
jgi:hypothetical protein